MKNTSIILYYGLFICLVLTITGIISAKEVNDLLASFIYLPLIFYFSIQIINQRIKNKPPEVKNKKGYRKQQSKEVIYPTQIENPNVSDNDKRLFLKLIGSAGFSLLFMALFTKKAQAAFFGSVPGPGVVSVKNIAGEKIDPAESHPTDGYEITEIDDASSPAYYGFLKKNGYWYIMKEDSTGAYRYSKGTSSFSTNWTNRASLTYNYFDNVFG